MKISVWKNIFSTYETTSISLNISLSIM